jgi:hypothetical protein
MVNDDSVCLPVFARFQVIEEAAYDAMYAASADPKAAIAVGSIAANAITATSIASDAIAATKIATGAITAAKFAADAITSTVIADNAITANKIASNALTAAKFAAGAFDAVWSVSARVLTAATNLVLPSNALGSITAWTVALTGNITGNLSGSVGSVTGLTASNLDATVSSRLASASYTAPDNSSITAIKNVTDNLPDSGALSSLATASGLAAVDAKIGTPQDLSSGTTLADNNYDVFNRTGGILNQNLALTGLVPYSGTIGDTGNDTTHIHLDAINNDDDEIIGMLLVLFDNSEQIYQMRTVLDWVASSQLATVATLPAAPESATDQFWLIAKTASDGGGPTVEEIRAEIDSNSTKLAAILEDTGTTLAATLAAPLPANVKQVNDITVDGAGTSGDPWGPA